MSRSRSVSTGAAAKGDLVVGSGTNTTAALSVGTNGQVLTADSTTTTGTKWATVAAGGMTLISTGTMSASTGLTFSAIPTTYKQLYLVWDNVYSSAGTTSDWMGLRLNNDSTSGNYYDSAWDVQINGTRLDKWNSATGTYFGSNSRYAVIVQGNTSATSYETNASGYCIIDRADQTTNRKIVRWTANPGTSATGPVNAFGSYLGTSAISQIDFVRNPSSTATFTGTIYLYGVN